MDKFEYDGLVEIKQLYDAQEVKLPKEVYLIFTSSELEHYSGSVLWKNSYAYATYQDAMDDCPRDGSCKVYPAKLISTKRNKPTPPPPTPPPPRTLEVKRDYIVPITIYLIMATAVAVAIILSII